MENLGVGVGLVVIGFWMFIAAAVAAGTWDSIRKREAQHETLRRIIESGQPMDHALMNKLLGSDERPDRGLKIAGLILLFIAPGLALFGWVISMLNSEALLPILGAAGLVGFVSIGLLVAGKYAERSYLEQNASARNQPKV